MRHRGMTGIRISKDTPSHSFSVPKILQNPSFRQKFVTPTKKTQISPKCFIYEREIDFTIFLSLRTPSISRVIEIQSS